MRPPVVPWGRRLVLLREEVGSTYGGGTPLPPGRRGPRAYGVHAEAGLGERRCNVASGGTHSLVSDGRPGPVRVSRIRDEEAASEVSPGRTAGLGERVPGLRLDARRAAGVLPRVARGTYPALPRGSQ